MFRLFSCVVSLVVVFLVIFSNLVNADAYADRDTDADYKLGPGDMIAINVLNEASLMMQIRLSARGTFSYPLIGTIDADGKTTREVEQIVQSGLSRKYLVDPQVTVNIIEFRKYFISGEVKAPGAYPFSPGLTVQHAIAIAGGITERASSQIYIIPTDKGSNVSGFVDIGSMVHPGDSIDIRAEPSKEVIVEGSVNNPGLFPFKSGMTVHKAIALAGGRNPRASDTVTVIHESDPTHTPQEVTQFSSVQPGDIIHVDESFF